MTCHGLLDRGDRAVVGREAADLLHEELILCFEQEFVLDIFLFLAQGIASDDNSAWNLLLMEILFYLIREHDPAEVGSFLPWPLYLEVCD